MKVYKDIEEINKILVKTIQTVKKHDGLTPYEMKVLVDVTAYLPKLLTNYDTMLKYLKDKADTEKATKILQDIGEM